MLGNYDDWKLRSPYEDGELYGTQECVPDEEADEGFDEDD